MNRMVEMRNAYKARRELNWSYMIGMFVEGFAEVEQMHEHLRAKVDGRMSPHEDGLYYRPRGFTEFTFEAQIEHAYHHLDWVWGCRHATLTRAAKCAWRDFRNWEKFPLAFRELLPDTPRRAVEAHSKTVLHFESILLGLDEAIRVGDEIYLGLCAHFDAKTCPCPIRWDQRAEKVAPLTERRLTDLLRRLLGALNFSWNVRRIPVERVRALSARARQRRRCYPAEFPKYLTKRHCRRRLPVHASLLPFPYTARATQVQRARSRRGIPGRNKL